MFFDRGEGGRSSARSTIALGLLVCGVVLGGLWALMLIGLAADLVWRLIPWRVG